MDRGCENGPPNGINPRPVNPFIGAANPATGHERGCLLDPRIRGLIYPTRERERKRETGSISKWLPGLDGLTITITDLIKDPCVCWRRKFGAGRAIRAFKTIRSSDNFD